MSRSLHGNADRQAKDQAIRDELSNEGYEVMAIPAGDLEDRDRMAKYCFRLGRILLDRPKADAIRNSSDWFVTQPEVSTPAASPSDGSGNTDLQETLELFEPEWRFLIKALAQHGDIQVDSGSDVEVNGQVVGTYTAQICRGTALIYLVDARADDGDDLRSALAAQGKSVLTINPTSPQSIDTILQAL